MVIVHTLGECHNQALKLGADFAKSAQSKVERALRLVLRSEGASRLRRAASPLPTQENVSYLSRLFEGRELSFMALECIFSSSVNCNPVWGQLQRLLRGAKIEHSGNFATALGIIQSNIGLTLLMTIANLPQVFESSSGGQALHRRVNQREGFDNIFSELGGGSSAGKSVSPEINYGGDSLPEAAPLTPRRFLPPG